MALVDDGVEHRLHVRGRGGDHLQDVGRRGLPLQRFRGLVEQPRVLDGDHGLVGKGLQQLDMMVGERAGLDARNADRADRVAVAASAARQHGCGSRVPAQMS